jgi:glycosyltransferase involved in cell wall biosynthesis
VGVVIPARNEEQYLGRTLESVMNQDPRPNPVIVVDDGSTDQTADVASEWGTSVIEPEHAETHRSLRIAEAINTGLAALPEVDFVAIVGADDVLDLDWLAHLLTRMRDDPLLVVAAAKLHGEPFQPEAPSGVRLVRASWWDPPRYDVVHGWETKLYYKALAEGKHAQSFPGVGSTCQRVLGSETDWYERGRALKALGLGPVGVLWRCYQHRRHPRRWFGIVRGYLDEKHEPEPWLLEYHSRARHGRRALRSMLSSPP